MLFLFVLLGLTVLMGDGLGFFVTFAVLFKTYEINVTSLLTKPSYNNNPKSNEKEKFLCTLP